MKMYCGAIWLASLLPFCAYAETVKIGRASVEMPAGAWTELASSEGLTQFDGGARSGIPTDDRLFVLKDGNSVVAILVFSSSKHDTPFVTNWANKCEGAKNLYASNIAVTLNGLGCAYATGKMNTLVYLKRAVPKMSKALESSDLALPPVSYSTFAVAANSQGTMLYVNLVASSAFAGSPEKPLADIPAGVNPRHAAWADRLAVAVQDSIYSLSGKLVLPTIEFVASRN